MNKRPFFSPPLRLSFHSLPLLSLSFLSLPLLSLLSQPSYAFQVESAPQPPSQEQALKLLEAGRATEKNVPEPIYLLSQCRYADALKAARAKPGNVSPWLETYLNNVLEASAPLVRHESAHFVLYTPPDQNFLADYALPGLEEASAHFEKVFGHRPEGKVNVEIYPTKETFSAASTLDEETLRRSGAIGICKFHRLMILTPQALPLGYRWMDALAHEYTHLMINELSASKAELWLHEGTARYFESSWRVDPPAFLTPNQKTQLKEGQEQGKLVSFKRMSPSLVYLKNQEEVSLAFAEVAHAVSMLVEKNGAPRFVSFLKSLADKDFPAAFHSAYGKSPEEFEKEWQAYLAQEKWVMTKGAMSDEVKFERPTESDIVGADAMNRMTLGDRMRVRNQYEAALVEYNRALEEEPDNALLLLKAARTHLAMNEKDEAITLLRRAVEKNPNYGTPHIELATMVTPQEALPLLETANAINPFDPKIHQMWAEALTAVGKTEEAEREKKVFELLMKGQSE